jgi:Flp pilus assembly protein TadG
MNEFAAGPIGRPDIVPAVPLRIVRSRGRSGRRRRGAAVVEFAIVAPVFFLFVFGMIEFGRMVMVHQLLTGAAREGARQAAVDGATTQTVEQAVRSYLTATSINGGEAVVTVSPDPATANPGVPVKVETAIAFAKVSWLPAPMYLKNVTLSGVAVMRRE